MALKKVLTLLLLSVSLLSFAQQSTETANERKMRWFNKTLSDFNKLHELQKIDDSTFVAITEEFNRLATHLQFVTGSVLNHPEAANVEHWIINFPEEFRAVTQYLEATNRQYITR